MNARPEIFVTTARVLAGASTDVLRALAREKAPDPSVFEERQPFFWLSEISNDRMDAYYGFMDAATTLVNFARDAAEGRAVLAAHNRWDLPFGYSLTGSTEQTADGGQQRTRVLSDAYTLRGLELGGVSTDSFIDGVRAGVLRDISVGFSLGEKGWYRCNVCGNDMMNYATCRHWPGMTYEEQGEDGVIRQVLATFTVIDGRLSEYSPVYDGATPSAGILKIQDAARAGELDGRARSLLESRYRSLFLPDRRLVVPGVALPSPPTPKEESMPPEPTPAEERAPINVGTATVEVTLTEAEIATAARSLAGLPEDAPEADIATALRTLAAELPQLREQAELGRQYRDDTVAEALRQAVRALGPEAEERYRPVLAGLPLDAVRAMRDDWAKVARAALPAGRITVDGGEPPPAPAPATEPPADVYRAG